MVRFWKHALIASSIILLSFSRPVLAQEATERVGGNYPARNDLSAQDIDRLLLEDSDTGVEDAKRRLKMLNKELDSRMPAGFERRNSDKMSKSMSKRLRRAEVVNYNRVDPQPKKKKKKKS
ncbi:MAG: hypothetical protein EBZ48_06430 [Proteobacteria bacterium]|nr:hypothetical protein [Pseudomonadota bacterium]